MQRGLLLDGHPPTLDTMKSVCDIDCRIDRKRLFADHTNLSSFSISTTAESNFKSNGMKSLNGWRELNLACGWFSE
jgi:hypothetical protein